MRERGEWKACRASLPVAFDTYHRDDQPDAVRAASHDTAPVVLAETEAGFVVLLGPDALDACAGSVDGLITAVERAAGDAGLETPPANATSS